MTSNTTDVEERVF